MVRFHNDIRPPPRREATASDRASWTRRPSRAAEQRGSDPVPACCPPRRRPRGRRSSPSSTRRGPSRSTAARTARKPAPRRLRTALGRPDGHQPAQVEAGVDARRRPARRRSRAGSRPCPAHPSCRPARAPRAGVAPGDLVARAAARSTVSYTSTRPATWRTLLVCNWPMKCTSAPCAARVALGDQLLGVVLADRRQPAASAASIASAPKPFVTASTSTPVATRGARCGRARAASRLGDTRGVEAGHASTDALLQERRDVEVVVVVVVDRRFLGLGEQLGDPRRRAQVCRAATTRRRSGRSRRR